MNEVDQLTRSRKEIDQLDTQLWEIVGQRTQVVRQIGEWKRQHGEVIVQPKRFEEVMQHCREIAKHYGLSETLVREVMEAIHKESIRVES